MNLINILYVCGHVILGLAYIAKELHIDKRRLREKDAVMSCVRHGIEKCASVPLSQSNRVNIYYTHHKHHLSLEFHKLLTC